MIKSIQKRLAIRSYAKQLGPALRKLYGRQKTYTPAQVKQTIGSCGLSADYACYAFAMYCHRDNFDQYHRDTGENCDFDAMRTEIAIQHFHLGTFDGSSGIFDGSAGDGSPGFGDSGSSFDGGFGDGGGGDSGGRGGSD